MLTCLFRTIDFGIRLPSHNFESKESPSRETTADAPAFALRYAPSEMYAFAKESAVSRMRVLNPTSSFLERSGRLLVCDGESKGETWQYAGNGLRCDL